MKQGDIDDAPSEGILKFAIFTIIITYVQSFTMKYINILQE